LKFYFVYLIGIPQSQHQSAQLGQAAHGALAFAISRLASGKQLRKQQFLNYFAHLLGELPMHPDDYRAGLKKGIKILSAYWDKYRKTWKKNTRAEYSITTVLPNSIKLRGRIDRLDFYPNGSIHVVDYKFKRPVKDENFYRQLIFYKFLLERATKWMMKDASI